jgi:hypothetical protein
VELVKLMQGQIWVTSEPGSGSTFHFTVQVGEEEVDEDEVVSTDALQGTRVLVAVAGETERSILFGIAHEAGCEVVEVGLASEAKERIDEALERDEPFDVILLDCRLPECDLILAYLRKRRIRSPLPSMGPRPWQSFSRVRLTWY